MAEQPWRNPRPAPQLSEVQPFIPQLPLIKSLRAWWPALLCAVVIFSMSTDTFSAAHTSRILEPFLRWLYPALTFEQFEAIHFLVRKTAHFTEYFVFAILLFRGIRRDRQGWRWTWGLLALFTAAIYSCLDEIHQAFVASRTASPYDSLLDSVGAAVAILVLFLWFRWRNAKIVAAE
ncbi:MAG TPA: VanZ family protein [Candidatus Dormibacteraeota bacterium]|nr:VanZ family protein [Candidatus Dormibacteraeota bacterium]